MRSLGDLQDAIRYGAVKRLRPKFMSVSTTFIGLVPIMWSIGAGADVMKRITAPLIGGIFTSFLLELVVYPAIYEVWKWHFEVKKTLPGRLSRPQPGRTRWEAAIATMTIAARTRKHATATMASFFWSLGTAADRLGTFRKGERMPTPRPAMAPPNRLK